MSEVTRRSRAFVEAHLKEAEALGSRLVDLLGDPDAFVLAADEGLAALGDPEYEDSARSVIPGLGPMHGVRNPLVATVRRSLRLAVRQLSPAESLDLADRLTRPDIYEVRLLAFAFLRRSLAPDPERTWQLMRQLAAAATSWVEVDVLAGLVANGILLEPYRWAELEQLVYSPNRWERRLVGSTIATLPSEAGRRRREALAGTPALALLGSLIGDAEPDVEKALSWALRTWFAVEPAATEAFLAAETERAVGSADGHRAWVIRDALPALSPDRARGLRDRLAGIRRRADAPSTSRAAAAAAPLADLTFRHREREQWRERWAGARAAASGDPGPAGRMAGRHGPAETTTGVASAMSLSTSPKTLPSHTAMSLSPAPAGQADENGSTQQP